MAVKMPGYIDKSHKCNELRSVYENEMALIKCIGAMEDRGILIDYKYVTEGLRYEQTEIERAKAAFQKETGYEYQDSPKFFKRLFDERGELYGKTDKGNASFAGDVLEELNTPTARLINRIRHHEKRAGTYWSSFLYYADSDGVLRATPNASGTVTGRFSYRNPNLQNLPKEDEEEDKEKPYVIRGSFKPRKGHSLVSVDYQAIEYRIFLDIAGEKSLIHMVNDGLDLHQATANMMGVSRKTAKTLGFMLLYGGGVDNLANQLGVSPSEARDLKALYFDRLPKVKRLVKDVQTTASQRGYIFNFLGRRCWLSNYDFAYKMPNALIQSTAADILKLAMVKIFKAELSGVHLLLTVHDELVFEIEHGSLDMVENICSLMTSVYAPKNGLPMAVEASISNKSLAKRDLVNVS